jgi:hypothetical protein
MGTSLDCLTETRADIEAVKSDEVTGVGMSHRNYLQESIKVTGFYKQHKDELEAGGMDFTKVAKMLTYHGAARQLYSDAFTLSGVSGTKRKAWEKAYNEAVKVVEDVRAGLVFAFQGDQTLLDKVAEIGEGNSIGDFIQDCNDVATVSRNNRELLEAIRYDMKLVERLSELAVILGELYADANVERSESPEQTLLRDKAFTLFKNAIDNLNAQARYIFRGDKPKALKFIIRDSRRTVTKKTDAAVTGPVVAK